MSGNRKITIITVAAGSGSRFGGPLPKQFCEIAGRPVVMRAIDNLRSALPEAEHILVLSGSEINRWNDLCHFYNFDSPTVVSGGSTRTESVRNALSIVDVANDHLVMVHDGARPFPSVAMVQALSAAFEDSSVDGALPVVPVTDSIRDISGSRSVAVDRSNYRAVQTPQAFRAALLLDAYSRCDGGVFTDDASVMEAAGFDKLVLVDGSPYNLKVTNPADIAIAEAVLAYGAL